MGPPPSSGARLCSVCGSERSPADATCPCGALRPVGGWVRLGTTAEEAARSPEGWILGDALWILGAPLSPEGPVLRYRATSPPDAERQRPAQTGVVLILSEPALYNTMEARTAALVAVRHPAVRRPLDVGRFRGRPYRVDPLGAPQTATTLLRSSGPLPLGEVLRMGVRLADGLVELHSRGLVHGHLSPDTVAVVQEMDGPHLVMIEIPAVDAGPWMPHVSPETCQGQRPDPRSDLFGLGLILLCLLRGSALPGDGVVSPWAEPRPGPALPLPSLPSLDEGLRQLLLSLLDRDANRRPRSAAEVWQALSAAQAGRLEANPRPSAPAARPARTSPAATGTPWVGITATVALIGAALWWMSAGPAGEPAPAQALRARPPAEGPPTAAEAPPPPPPEGPTGDGAAFSGTWTGLAGERSATFVLLLLADGTVSGTVELAGVPHPLSGRYALDAPDRGRIAMVALRSDPPTSFTGHFTERSMSGGLLLDGKDAGAWSAAR